MHPVKHNRVCVVSFVIHDLVRGKMKSEWVQIRVRLSRPPEKILAGPAVTFGLTADGMDSLDALASK